MVQTMTPTISSTFTEEAEETEETEASRTLNKKTSKKGIAEQYVQEGPLALFRHFYSLEKKLSIPSTSLSDIARQYAAARIAGEFPVKTKLSNIEKARRLKLTPEDLFALVEEQKHRDP